jgi:hypothetical protein
MRFARTMFFGFKGFTKLHRVTGLKNNLIEGLDYRCVAWCERPATFWIFGSEEQTPIYKCAHYAGVYGIRFQFSPCPIVFLERVQQGKGQRSLLDHLQISPSLCWKKKVEGFVCDTLWHGAVCLRMSPQPVWLHCIW